MIPNFNIAFVNSNTISLQSTSGTRTIFLHKFEVDDDISSTIDELEVTTESQNYELSEDGFYLIYEEAQIANGVVFSIVSSALETLRTKVKELLTNPNIDNKSLPNQYDFIAYAIQSILFLGNLSTSFVNYDANEADYYAEVATAFVNCEKYSDTRTNTPQSEIALW